MSNRLPSVETVTVIATLVVFVIIILAAIFGEHDKPAKSENECKIITFVRAGNGVIIPIRSQCNQG